jgi:uracil-DNA glycosylase
MNWEKFKDLFHESWHDKMRPFIESEACDKIYDHLKTESKRGKKIAPLSHNVWRCFKETPLNEVKVILIGMCPYHTLSAGSPIADGLMMSCSTTSSMQPSLHQLYDGIERELYGGFAIDRRRNPDLLFLAKQGVLLCNAALTTEINKAGSHLELWEPFMKYLLEEVFAWTGVPIVFFGKEASKLKKYVAPFTFWFSISHPASAAYKNGEWDTEGVFTKINKIIKDSNGYTIDWLEKVDIS